VGSVTDEPRGNELDDELDDQLDDELDDELEDEFDDDLEDELDEDVVGEVTAGSSAVDGAALARLEQELAAAQAQAAEYLDGWRRAQADLANQRKRHEREKSETISQANARLVAQLLPVLDDVERALANVPAEVADEHWLDGVRLIARKFQQALENSGVRPIPVEPGQPFDPNVHEAILHEPAAGFESGQVVAELQKGYTLGERVIRPATVKVAR
jgi:molecular chaperone GrpE